MAVASSSSTAASSSDIAGLTSAVIASTADVIAISGGAALPKRLTAASPGSGAVRARAVASAAAWANVTPGLSLASAGAFPSPARANVLWTGLSGDRKALGELAMSVSAGARRAGAPPPDEGRRYRPHELLDVDDLRARHLRHC